MFPPDGEGGHDDGLLIFIIAMVVLFAAPWIAIALH